MIRKVDPNMPLPWNFKVMFPSGDYAIRCIDETVGTSNSSGNPMVTLKWEILNSSPVTIGDQLYDMDGATFTKYHVTRDNKDAKKSNVAFKNYQENILNPCGIDTAEGWDDENPPSVKGKVVYASLVGKEEPMYSKPTAEDISQGRKIGKPVTDPITGKEVKTWKIDISRIYGLYDGEVRPS